MRISLLLLVGLVFIGYSGYAKSGNLHDDKNEINTKYNFNLFTILLPTSQESPIDSVVTVTNESVTRRKED